MEGAKVTSGEAAAAPAAAPKAADTPASDAGSATTAKDAPPAPDGADADATKALLKAIKRGDLKAAQAAARGLHLPDVRTSNGGTPLHMACFGGHVELEAVKWLHGRGAAVGPGDARGATPLHLACLGGPPVVRWLLFYGADAAATTRDGATPIMLARQAGQDACAAVVENHQLRRKEERERDAKRQRMMHGYQGPAYGYAAPPRPAFAPPPPGPHAAGWAPPPPAPVPASAAAPPPAAGGVPAPEATIGATPSETFQSDVPVSAKAQYETARDYMASEAMRKMGRRGVQKRIPTWLQSTTLE
ncbi:hypothetical protein JL721_8952 [Aureococcus anophagefferens]|nr:hypothetical protein JL721_8952 [Aureococcus anophagefferens]